MDDWLANMGDWCISRKRYWGLPLPFYRCACGRITVVGSRPELRALAVDPTAVDAVPELHRPWIDDVLIQCPGCGRPVRRILEVGDCWLDAGIVPFSTLGYREDRQPVGTVVPRRLRRRGRGPAPRVVLRPALHVHGARRALSPYRTVLAHERVLAADGREMHKSWGNAVWLDDAVDDDGPRRDPLPVRVPGRSPSRSASASRPARDVKRRFLTFWNVYSLFVTYANLDRPPLCAAGRAPGATRRRSSSGC